MGQTLSCRLYAVISNQQAMNELLSLWRRWCNNPQERARRGFGPFKSLFQHLRDLRRWDVSDRLAETGVLETWQENLRYEQGPIRFEVELWCRDGNEAQRRAYGHLERLVGSEGGRCVSQCVLPQIQYHGVLAELPAEAVQRTVDRILDKSYTDLLRCEEVMFFRPRGQFAHPLSQDEAPTGPPAIAPEEKPSRREPVVALIDGLPLSGHELLNERLIIDDPDDVASRYAPRQQEHGTAMASLIIHGDLGAGEAPLERPIYVRPILMPSEDLGGNVYEKTPDETLLVDLIYRCIHRLKDGEEPVAPSIRIVNLSIGNPYQPFDRQLSPLARLLDWLAWKYKLLFFVSVGNQGQPITIATPEGDWKSISDDELRDCTLKAMWNDQRNRRPFSPAEAVNVVTVGAMHEDASTPHDDRRVDLLKGAKVTSPLGTVAAGFRRAVKPEVLFPGGRQLYTAPVLASNGEAEFRVARSDLPPGLRVATPGQLPFELNRTTYSRGSSNATALATRTSGRSFERLLTLPGDPADERLSDQYCAVLLKTLAIHGASCGEGGGVIDAALGPSAGDWREKQRFKSRILGYGRVEEQRALSCTDERATLIGWGAISDGVGHLYELPLPPCLAAQRIKRRLTITLAWLTPINPRHRCYRKANLWFSKGEDALGFGLKDHDADTARRGTVHHQVFEGESARAFSDGNALVIKVNCSADAGKLTEEIPYGLAVSLEVAPGIQLPIYEEVRARIRPRVAVRP